MRLIGFVMLTAGLLLVASPTWGVQGPGGAIERQVIELTNKERAKAGLPAVTEDARLMACAQSYARVMAKKDRLGHFLDGTPGQRITRAGYKWSTFGENVAFGSPTAEGVMKQWMTSPGHKANVLSRSVVNVGVGRATTPTGRPYYCQVFAAPLGKAGPAAAVADATAEGASSIGGTGGDEGDPRPEGEGRKGDRKKDD